MDNINKLLNDSDIDDIYEYSQNDENINPADSNDTYSSRTLGPYLGINKDKLYSENTTLQSLLTLRNCNLAYRYNGGIKNKDSTFAEFDRCQTKGCISPMRRFDNIVGHFQTSTTIGTNKCNIICFEPELLTSLTLFCESLEVNLLASVNTGYLWNILNSGICFKTETNKWMFNTEILDERLSTALEIMCASFKLPLSCHSKHAYFESLDMKDIFYKYSIYKEPKETTAVTGIFGTLQNNQLIDLAQDEDENQIDIENRYKDIDVPGFLCSGHTAHSSEAGRVRRVCCDVNIRIMCKTMLEKLYKVLQIADKYNTGPKQWILFCLGKFVYCTEKALLSIRNKLVTLFRSTTDSPTLYINTEFHTALLSISSGVLLRKDCNNYIIDTTSVTSSLWPDKRYIPSFPSMVDENSLRFYFSGFFLLTPYITFDRPPRTLISSVQSVQVVTTPYGAGTSSVAPVHTSKPLVSTPFIEELLSETMNTNKYNLADLIPGEDLVVCFANHNETNEDSIMMSEGSAARGLFSYLAYSVHLIKNTEKIPNIGDSVNINDNKWWKTYSRRNAQIDLPNNKSTKAYIAGGNGKGIVVDKKITSTGEISVKCVRYSTPVTGDKLATGHGQKGVIKLIPEVDMPWGIDDRNEVIKFDIVISLSSISNRITTGQYYEMISGVEGAKQGNRIVVAPSEYHTRHLETVLYDGQTGVLLTRISDTTEVPIQASWGINRVWQMTQLTWDKQHYTHGSASKFSITTGVGRTAGGGIKFGEMEAHAVESSGLIEPYRELRSRMDLINTQICTNCDMLVQMCSCDSTEGYVNVAIPHSLMVFSHSNLLTSNLATKFKVTF